MTNLPPGSKHVCKTCGVEFTIRPAVPEGTTGYENCLGPECASYDPDRDLDILFMSDKQLGEHLNEITVVSMDKLRQRQKGIKSYDGTYLVDITEL